MERIGIISNYIPEEIIEVFGIPHRILGDFGNIPDPQIPSLTCSFVREFVTAFNSGNLNFVSGIIIPQSCDSLYASFDLLKRDGKFVYRFSQPIKNTPESHEYSIKQIKTLIRFLENYFSLALDNNRLVEIIKSGNTVRMSLRSIGYLISRAKIDIPYKDFLSIVLKVMQNRFEDMEGEIKEKYNEFAEYDTYSDIKRKVMLVGPILDNFDIIDIIENFDSTKIVFDNITNGWRYFDNNIPEDRPPMEAISRYYLSKLQSPTFDNDDKYLARVRQGIDEFGVNCVIMVNQRGCEPHCFYIPTIQQICDIRKIPFLPLNMEHKEESLENIKIKIHTLLEMM
jgi:benzoyl-CoA reductase/2-hydroxyglutaryl-CoA dehydratase subunit BcrC/BadD/HgdB